MSRGTARAHRGTGFDGSTRRSQVGRRDARANGPRPRVGLDKDVFSVAHGSNLVAPLEAEEGSRLSQVLDAIKPQLNEIEAGLPPGYRLEIGGTKELSDKGVGVIGTTMAVSMRPATPYGLRM